MLTSKTKRNILKISALLIISFFIFIGFGFSKARAQDANFYITPNKTSAVIGQSITITATRAGTFTSWGNNRRNATFTIFPTDGGTFSQSECNFLYYWTTTSTCTVDLKISKAGTLKITAYSVDYNGQSHFSSISIITTGTESTATKTNYSLLESLPDGSGGTMANFESDPNKNPCAFGKYMNIMIKLFLGICAVLAMIMIFYGGITYMTSEVISEKSAGRETITNAIFGLLIALGAYILLFTINPDLLNLCLDQQLPQVQIDIGGETDAPISADLPTIIKTLPSGIICSGGQSNIPNITSSFAKKMTYEMGAKGTPGPNNTIKLDCSGYVNYVLKCAGLPFVNSGTSGIFSGAEKVTSISGTKVNGKELQLGDLVGWRKVDTVKYKYGHVMIYVGNGNVQVSDSHGGSSVGNALGIFPITRYQDEIKYIKRVQ